MSKRRAIATSITVAASLLAGAAHAATAKQSSFGMLEDGREVPKVTLSNGKGVEASIIAYGATLQAVILPDRDGKSEDVALGYDNIRDYIEKPQYFGSTVGRFANRLAGGHFTIAGQNYQTPVNNGKNSLHGGSIGFDKVLWDVVSVKEGPTASVTLRYVSRDGDQGYPGTMTVLATYSLDEDSQLTIEYVATTDKTTIVNITNHAYWNLLGEGTVNGAMWHLLTIPAETYLPTDEGAIPTGELRPVVGTVFDFRKPRQIGKDVRDASDEQIRFGRGYDHNWVVSRTMPKAKQLMARVFAPGSGRGFELWSNQPGVQFYSGNFLDGTSYGKAMKIYRMGDAIVLEPQVFPDTPNQKGFPSAQLEPGETYRNVMTYRFTVNGAAPTKR